MARSSKERLESFINRGIERASRGVEAPNRYYEILKRYRDTEAFPKVVRESMDLTPDVYDLIERSTTFSKLNVGDVISFYYVNSDQSIPLTANFLAVIVKNKRAPTGTFTSTQGNHLLSCYRVDHLGTETLRIVTEGLNKNEQLKEQASYKKFTAILKLLAGETKYRTFNKMNMSLLKKISIEEIDPRDY